MVKFDHTVHETSIVVVVVIVVNVRDSSPLMLLLVVLQLLTCFNEWGLFLGRIPHHVAWHCPLMSTPFVVGFGIKKERREDILNCCRHDSIGFKYTIQILVEFCVNWATIKEKGKKARMWFFCVMTRQPCVLPCVSGVSPGRSFLYVHQAGQRADGSPLIQLTGTAGYATVTLNPLTWILISNSLPGYDNVYDHELMPLL